MASKFSDAEREAILREGRELLQRWDDEDDAGKSCASARSDAEPELAPEQILQEALAAPCETHNERVRREISAREADWAARRAQRDGNDAKPGRA